MPGDLEGGQPVLERAALLVGAPAHPAAKNRQRALAPLLASAQANPGPVKAAAAAAVLLALLAGLRVSPVIAVVLAVCMVMLGVAFNLAASVLAKDEGTADMQEISQAIRDGAEGYFATQYGTIGRLSGIVGGLIFVVYLFRRETLEQQASG
jgi:hypothetical protein